jgi:hypothetical protein
MKMHTQGGGGGFGADILIVYGFFKVPALCRDLHGFLKHFLMTV